MQFLNTILAIETTGPYCSVALSTPTEVDMINSEERLSHLQNLVPMVEEILQNNNLKLEDLDAIAVSKGPGSFTGIRIGVTTARAFSQVKGVPLVMVPTLNSFGTRTDGIACPLFDARRNQVYAGAFKDQQILVEGSPYDLDEYLNELKKYSQEKIVFFGDGIDVYEEKIREFGEKNLTDFHFERESQYQDGLNILTLGQIMFDKGEITPVNKAVPDYMRKSEAERKLEEKNAGK